MLYVTLSKFCTKLGGGNANFVLSSKTITTLVGNAYSADFFRQA